MTDDVEGVWVFRLRPGMSSITFRRGTLPSFGRRAGEREYRIVEDPDVAERLQDKEKVGRPMFQWVAPEDVEAALDSAEDAIEQIEAGEWDDCLAYLLVAERRAYGRRVTVIEAIAGRNRKIIEERADEGDEDVLTTDDIVTAG